MTSREEALLKAVRDFFAHSYIEAPTSVIRNLEKALRQYDET
jgi:HAMP domain-containing protein